jgi:N-acetylneuraminate synthase
MRQDSSIEILGKKIGLNEPVYFIADIAANHDGDLQRAIELIELAADAGANAAKFQHFQAETIVSDEGFNSLKGQLSHQSKWKKSVFEVYQDASVDVDWTPSLKKACDKAGITFFTSPYSIELVDAVDPYVPAYKIGSGDITWLEIIKYIAGKKKPYFLATGASTIKEVQKTVEIALKINPQLALLQCNTNYTASLENFKYVQLNVLRTYREMYPDLILGLSDHTPGHATVLGSVALGARIIEKHFTDDTSRIGPDHNFSMNPISWREMVDRTRELECSLGAGVKKVEDNEKETVILQRRSIRLNTDLQEGAILTRESLAALRPCPGDALPLCELDNVVGRQLKNQIKKGDYIRWSDIK